MASLTPLSESVPSAAVEPLTLAMAPKLIGSPALIVTHPNLSLLHLSVPPPPPPALVPPQAAASVTRAAARASPASMVRFFIFPPPWGWSPAPQSSGSRTGAWTSKGGPLLSRQLLPHPSEKLQVSP